MKRLAVLFAVCFAVLVPARGAAPFFDDNSASHWMTYYYVDKDVEHVGAFVHWLAAVDFSKKANFTMPAAGFLAALFRDSPDKVRGWVTEVQPNDGAKAVIERALWLSGHADLIKEVFHDAPDYAKEKPFALMNLSLETPGAWDVMWAAFFATGDTKYPARLIDLLDDGTAITGNKKVDAAYRKIVAWSLASNMSQHELILRMVRREAETRTGPVQQKLKDMLAEVEAEHMNMPDCDGDFCATLALISEENLKELDKPYDQGPVLTELREAKTGDHIAVVFAFGGMALADDLTADVTYDLKVVRPDGALYDKEHKDLPALKRKVPQRFVVFDNRPAIVLLRFEPKDARGTYRVEAVMKDNIGGKTVKLAKEIALKD